MENRAHTISVYAPIKGLWRGSEGEGCSALSAAVWTKLKNVVEKIKRAPYWCMETSFPHSDRMGKE